jgi:hypothetical protein
VSCWLAAIRLVRQQAARRTPAFGILVHGPIRSDMPTRRALRWAAALAPVLAFLAVYVPRAGHGFIADDYRWVLESQVSTVDGALALFAHNNGFYRPLVALTFTVDRWLFGLNPLGYGLTNVALAVACAAMVYRLARALEMPWGAAALAGSIWLLNFHGINMAVLWISGRTALLLTLASVAAATCLVRRQLLPAAAWTAVALLSKEEAVLLPLILTAWLYVWPAAGAGERRRALWRWIACAAVLLAGYAVLRQHSGAMTPATAQRARIRGSSALLPAHRHRPGLAVPAVAAGIGPRRLAPAGARHVRRRLDRRRLRRDGLPAGAVEPVRVLAARRGEPRGGRVLLEVLGVGTGRCAQSRPAGRAAVRADRRADSPHPNATAGDAGRRVADGMARTAGTYADRSRGCNRRDLRRHHYPGEPAGGVRQPHEHGLRTADGPPPRPPARTGAGERRTAAVRTLRRPAARLQQRTPRQPARGTPGALASPQKLTLALNVTRRMP